MSKRYSRNIAVIGEDGQRRLRESSVLVIGCGALGGQCAMELAGSGVGKIGLVDFDTIGLSNLQRQLFFRESEAGKMKAAIIAERIRALNSDVEICVYTHLLTSKNFGEIAAEYDFVEECTDNAATKLLVEQECRRLSKACCIGGVAGWRGQLTTMADGRGGMAQYFPDMAQEADGLLPCAIEGVMAPTAAMIASLQAAEAIKYLTGKGELLIDSLQAIDIANNLYIKI